MCAVCVCVARACAQYFSALRRRMMVRKRHVLLVLPALLLSVRSR